MRDPLVPLCQALAEKLRENPQAAPAALVAYLREVMAAVPHIAAALQTDARVVQINQGNATAFQTWVREGGVANIGIHLHEVDTTTLASVLERLFREQRQAQQLARLASVGGASKFRGTIEAFCDEYLVTESGLPTVPFGGRNEDLALLDAWLNEETAPPRYLLTAPAGRGKSALLVRWLQHLQAQGRVERDVSASWQLVFVPISIRFETHRPEIFYEALAVRLTEILGEELPPTHTDKGVYYADHCRILASTAVAQGRRILIVLDGIDEALGERFDAHWFPRNPGTKLRLVLSARWQAGDLDSSGWKTRLGWDRDVRTQSRELPILDREGVRDLLSKLGAPTDVLASRPNIVDRLHELAEGEPLVLRYYAEDIWSRGEAAPRLTINDLAQLRPGLGAYFERWLDDQERLWAGTSNPVDRQRVEVLLALLACAHGRLKEADLRVLLAERGEATAGARFLEQLKPIQRFVIGLEHPETGTAGYILSHPKLGIHLREEHFDPEYIQATQAAFVRWGQKTVERLNKGMLQPEQTPAYLLQYHTQHLQDASAPANAFLELVEQEWLRAWETFEGGYRGFARDMRLAYEALSRDHAADQPRCAQRLRCQLVLSSIHSIGANMSWRLLVAACKADVLTYRQVAYWLEFKPPVDRAQALGALARHLPAELRAEVLGEALAAARSLKAGFFRARVLGVLAPHLPAELLGEALAIVRSLEARTDRVRVLSALAPHLPAELLGEALAIVRSLETSHDRAQALGSLALRLSGNLLQQGFEELLDILPRCRRNVSLLAVSSFFPLLEEFEGPKGLEEVRRAIVDTTRWFP